jgi:GTP-binding protein LepA
MESIRNFCIIAHIDHGKSTLADRFLEICNPELARKLRSESQMLDSLALEKERGITIKLAPIRLIYEYGGSSHDFGGEYILNLIDTPGHVDFGYEVSRSLASVEGAILLVDATQGIQAQTIANMEQAIERKLKIIPVVNKVDVEGADYEGVALEIADRFGFDEQEIIYASGKTGLGVKDILNRAVEIFPPPNRRVSVV